MIFEARQEWGPSEERTGYKARTDAHGDPTTNAAAISLGRPRGSVVFDFRLGRDRDGPKRFLGDFAGRLQSDGYGAYDQVWRRLGARGRWAHAWRKFFDAVKIPKNHIRALSDAVWTLEKCND